MEQVSLNDSSIQSPVRLKLETVLGYVLNTSVLIGSILVIAALSFEVFYDPYGVYYPQYMQIQLWVCIVFLVDFFFRFYLAKRKLRFFWKNLFFFLVAIPYLNLAGQFELHVSQETEYFLRLIPLIRGGYGLAIAVGWVLRSRVTSLLVSYILIILSLTYFASLVFFMLERPVNPSVATFGDALWWAFMNVTTVGSNIFAKTVTGEILSVVLAASGMMLFPIFTVYITDKFQSRKQQDKENSGAD
ncbi:MAG TPA: potassium channel family protein [Candidatus Alistipes merdigallinarum]|nr:potassium channel family protein [Candidatus Alistipes merdigallinarum]